MSTISEDLITAGKSAAGGWTKVQFALIGISWPPLKGWKAVVIGKEIADEDAAAFIAGKGVKAKGAKKAP